MTLSGLDPGTLFARDFRIVRRLGEGGMGRVYVVEQLSTGALRALKLMHPVLVRDERFVRRFEQEARVCSRIESDHVVHVLAAGVDEESAMPWLVMELLEGERLSDLLEQRAHLSIIEAQEVMSQLCHGLGAAHAIGVVHRDLKPENIFLARARREGVPFTVKLLDFGIAKVMAEQVSSTQTEALGSVMWMAPEQTVPGTEITAAADVWALGLLAFRLLTGVHYWKSASQHPPASAMILREVVLDPIVPPIIRAGELNVADRIPRGFDAWFGQCLTRDARKRFADATAAKAALMHVLHEAGGVSPEPDAAVSMRASLLTPPIQSTAPVVSPQSVTFGDLRTAQGLVDREAQRTMAATTGSAVLPPSSTRPIASQGRWTRWRRAALCALVAGVVLTLGVQFVRSRMLSTDCQKGHAVACRRLCGLVLFGSARDCLNAGGLFLRSSAASDTPAQARAPAREQALAAYSLACERGERAGCTQAGALRQQGILHNKATLRDDVAAAALFRQACDAGRGDPDGCVLYGAALRMGQGTGRSSDNQEAYNREAAEHFKLACDPARGGRGCFWLGYLYQYGTAELKVSSSEAEARFRLGCAGGRGDPLACNQLAEFYEHGVFTPHELFPQVHEDVFPEHQAEALDRYGQAFSLWDSDCRAGNAHSCLRAAFLLWKGKSENPAPDRAAERMKLACDMGYAPGCERLHALCRELHARPGSADPTAACNGTTLLSLACDGLWAHGCMELAQVSETAQDKERALRTAERLFVASCNDGDGGACLRLALLYQEGRPGLPPDISRSVAFLDRACDRDEAEGCKRLGDVLRTGEGLSEPRLDRALQHYSKACELLNSAACFNAAMMLRAGQGADADAAKAAELLRHSCDLRAAQGCFELARMHQRGEGVSNDNALARKYLARACGGCGVKPPDACAALGESLLASGSGDERRRGLALLVEACDSGRLAAACMQVHRAMAEGATTARDPVGSREYARKACSLGLASACYASR